MQFWTATHFKTQVPALVVMILISVALRWLLQGKREKWRWVPLQAVGAFIAVLEIAKQIYSISVGYDFYHLPFHVCSVITVAIPVMAFYRGRGKEMVDAVTTALSGGLFFLIFIMPNGIYSATSIQRCFDDFLSFHTTAFHLLATFAFVLIVVLQLYRPTNLHRDFKAIAVVLSVYGVLAATAAQIFKQNFHNLYYCIFPPVEKLRLAFCAALGNTTGHLLYLVLFLIANIIGVWMAHLICYAISRLMERLSK